MKSTEVGTGHIHQASGSPSPVPPYSIHVTVAWRDNLGTVIQAGHTRGCFLEQSLHRGDLRTQLKALLQDKLIRSH